MMMSQNVDPKPVFFDPAALNNEGVTWLLRGKRQEAVASFKHALVAMKQSLVQIPPDQLEGTTSTSVLYASVELPVYEDKYYLYSRAMVFPSNCGSVTEREYPLYSSLILFNIALAHHISALMVSNERAIRDATYFYNVSLQILKSIEPHFHKRVIAPIKLANLNNISVVQYEHGDARKAHATLEATRELLAPSVVLVDESDDTFDQEDFDGVTLNAVMFKWTFSAPTA